MSGISTYTIAQINPVAHCHCPYKISTITLQFNSRTWVILSTHYNYIILFLIIKEGLRVDLGCTLLCPKCKQETLISVKGLHATVITEPDKKTWLKKKRRNPGKGCNACFCIFSCVRTVYLPSCSTSATSFAVAVTIRNPLSLIPSSRVSSCRRCVDFSAFLSGKKNWSTDILYAIRYFQ